MGETVKLSISDTHILAVCCRIEETCSELYRYFSRLYADNPQASALWDKTSKEEDNHAEQFRLAYRLQGSGIQELKTDMDKATSILTKIQSVYEGVRKSPPPLMEALRFAIKLERSLANYHMHAIAVFDDNSMASLFSAMMRNDREHIQRLEKAAEAAVVVANKPV